MTYAIAKTGVGRQPVPLWASNVDVNTSENIFVIFLAIAKHVTRVEAMAEKCQYPA
jgi:hypothetical protein